MFIDVTQGWQVNIDIRVNDSGHAFHYTDHADVARLNYHHDVIEKKTAS